jgi:hypothetical protein
VDPICYSTSHSFIARTVCRYGRTFTFITSLVILLLDQPSLDNAPEPLRLSYPTTFSLRIPQRQTPYNTDVYISFAWSWIYYIPIPTLISRIMTLIFPCHDYVSHLSTYITCLSLRHDNIPIILCMLGYIFITRILLAVCVAASQFFIPLE